ncbi:MAG: hypothetical protein IJA14_01025, partial [Alphaproteobacteria bacterium]|nr:hypothetical protein [Alphaproteobacteria bacterium]
MYRIEEQIIYWCTNLIKKISGKNLIIFVPYVWIFLFFICPCLILIKLSFSEDLLASPPYSSLI